MTYKIAALIVPLTISSLIDTSIDIGIKPPFIDFPSSFSLGDLSLNPDVSFVPFEDDYFGCSNFGPFSLSTVTNGVGVDFTYELNSVSSQNLIERVRLFNASNSVVFSSSKAYKYYNKGTRESVSFSLPIRDHLTRDGLTIKFELVKESNYQIIKEYSSTFYPTSDAYINWTSLKGSEHTSKELGFYSNSRMMMPLIETLDFTRFSDYLDVDNYYRLDVSNNRIYYPKKCTFKYNSASLIFNDNERLFPYLNHQSNGDITLPLTMSQVDKYIKFAYKDTFYINKRTLQLSNSYRDGYAATKDFYLPINGKKKFNGKLLYFVLEGIGLDNISTTIPVKYDVSKSLMSVCTDGDYCVIGGRR